MFLLIFVMGCPRGRASRLYRIWLQACTGFHVSQCVFTTGPPALSGFPSTRTEASSIDRRPCLVDFCSELFALWGCPGEHNMASGSSPPRGVYFKFRICEIRMLARVFRLLSVVGRRVCPVGFTGDLRVGFPQTPNEGTLCYAWRGGLAWPAHPAFHS